MADLQNSGRRPHLTNRERIPRCYKEVEKVLQEVKTCKGNIKTIMYNSRLRGSVFNKVYALAVNILKYRHLLDKIIEETELLKKESGLRKELAGIMIYEIIFGKGLPGESKPVITIKKYQKDFERIYKNSLKDGSISFTGFNSLPKYARVNTLKNSVSGILKDLEDWEYQQLFYEDSATLDEFLDLVRSLKTGSFLIDYHFKDLLVFSSEENLSTWPLFQRGHVFIQDKSSYIPVYALDPKPNSTILDACAAPGMKTAHIAALMENNGKIYAYERSKERFEVLIQMLESADVKICTPRCDDFYLVNQDDPKFHSVECILVDPTCSGSGMVNRMDNVTDTEDSKNVLRIQKLAGFQILLLKHALLFPSVKRIVYSTCSMTEEENEFVVHEVLNHFKDYFKLVPVMPDWPVRGSDNFEFGTLCLRAYPEKNLTNGFFVAMFERLNFEEQQLRQDLTDPQNLKKTRSKMKKIKSELQESSQCYETYSTQERSCADPGIQKKENGYFCQENSFSDNHTVAKPKSKKKKLSPELQEDSQYYEAHASQDQNNSNPDIQKKESSYFPQENSFPDSQTVAKTKSKKKKLLSDLQENSLDCDNQASIQSCATDLKIVDNLESLSCVNETEGFSENCTGDQSYHENVSTRKKKHKKKHSHRNDIFEVTEPHPEPCFSEITPTSYVDGKNTSLKRKKKQLDISTELEEVNVSDNENTRNKHKKSKKAKLADIKDQPFVEDKGRHLEEKIKHMKIKKAVTSNDDESNGKDFENDFEAQEPSKKKHKKKCKDKKHKGE